MIEEKENQKNSIHTPQARALLRGFAIGLLQECLHYIFGRDNTDNG
ncbi:hypothetical protein NOC27_1679 [Nitrosococcus oceani AFC27]|nr:hypothetical protein NOC27_1679 [Nitrosococcus oceani AFC27]